jgi:hypothetical protein
MRRQALDRERSGDADLLDVFIGLVVEHLEIGVTLDRSVDLVAAHTLDDVGVVGDRLQGDVLHPLVHKPLADVAPTFADRQRRASELLLLGATPWGIGEEEVGKLRRHQPLTCKGESDA